VYSHETSNDRKGHVRRRGRLLAGISISIIDAVFSRKKRATEVPQHRPERGVIHYGMVWREGVAWRLVTRVPVCFAGRARVSHGLVSIRGSAASRLGGNRDGYRMMDWERGVKCELRLWDGFAPG